MRALAALLCLACCGAYGQADVTQAALERATRTPLEIIWLQAELEAETWRRDPRLTGVVIGSRPKWRYVFGAASPVEAARLVVSTLEVPDAPFPAGRLSLSGSGRVYIVTPPSVGRGAVRPPAGMIILAAGATVQLVDVAYPAIRIEVSAPREAPLLLGDLAAADIAHVVGLIAKRTGVESASAVDVDAAGQVAFRSGAGVQVAAAAPAAAKPDLLAAIDMTGFEPRADRLPPAPDPIARIDMTGFQPRGERLAPKPDLLAALAGVSLAGIEARGEKPPAAPDLIARIDMTGFQPRGDQLPAQPDLIARIDMTGFEPRGERIAAALPPPPAPHSGLERMRAEVEAEIERERARLARALRSCAEPGAYRDGCAIATPRRFSLGV